MFRVALALALILAGEPAAAEPLLPELSRWRAQAARVTITRDSWGIPHVSGASDADAVFGAMYAQAEDDFPRIEANYLAALGRMAEAEGETALYADLRARLYNDPAELRRLYRASPEWLRKLMTAWADGLNFYLAIHPRVRPRVIRRFEPWMALSFTEGSIGGDIERIDLDQLRSFYGGHAQRSAARADRPSWVEPNGSNGIAIAPANTLHRRALLLINPHTSFYFRAELQMTSQTGLNAYGASTWGQFFIYQGFNASAGWMHTSSGSDAVDEFIEDVRKTTTGWSYRYGASLRPINTSSVEIAVRQPDGRILPRRFTIYRTHRGPIVRRQRDKWVSVALMHKPIAALSQSFLAYWTALAARRGPAHPVEPRFPLAAFKRTLKPGDTLKLVHSSLGDRFVGSIRAVVAVRTKDLILEGPSYLEFPRAAGFACDGQMVRIAIGHEYDPDAHLLYEWLPQCAGNDG